MQNHTNSQQTGSPRRIAESLPPISDSMRTQPPRHSSTIGPERARAQSEQTGLALGESGAAARPLGRWVKDQMGGFNLPEATMRSISSSLTSHVAPTTSSVWGGDGQFTGTKLGPFGLRKGWNRADLVQDLALLRGMCRGGKRAEIAHEVAKLMVRTKSRAHGDGEARLMAETMVQDLSAYPIDVVRFACEYWVDGGADAKFTPSWPELKEICEKRMDGRRRLVRCLEHHLAEPSQ